MNIVPLLLILFGGTQLSHGEKLKCQFRDVYYFDTVNLYACEEGLLDNHFNNITIDGFTGEYNANRNESDVKGIFIHHTNTKYVPANLGNIFNLNGLIIEKAQLIEIRSNDFIGMQDLEYLSIHGNKLRSVPSNAFSTLSKLKEIWLSFNEIIELPYGLFMFNLNLKKINLNSNKLKFIDTEFFNGLPKLNEVLIYNNICIDKHYIGATELIKSKNDLKINCFNPNEVPSTTKTPINDNRIEEQLNNVNLQRIHLNITDSKFFGSEVFDGFDNLFFVRLGVNVCLIIKQSEVSNRVIELKNELKLLCQKPIYVILFDMGSSITYLKRSNTELKSQLQDADEKMIKAETHRLELLSINKLREELQKEQEEKVTFMLKRESMKKKEFVATQESHKKKLAACEERAFELNMKFEEKSSDNCDLRYKEIHATVVNDMMIKLLNAINVQQNKFLELNEPKMELFEISKERDALKMELLKAKKTKDDKVPKM